jgi:hypothetical protein
LAGFVAQPVHWQQLKHLTQPTMEICGGDDDDDDDDDGTSMFVTRHM